MWFTKRTNQDQDQVTRESPLQSRPMSSSARRSMISKRKTEGAEREQWGRSPHHRPPSLHPDRRKDWRGDFRYVKTIVMLSLCLINPARLGAVFGAIAKNFCQ